MRFAVPLEIDGITESGLILTGGTYAHHPDEHVTFEMAVNDYAGTRRIRLCRLDWRSLQDGHSNLRKKCSGQWAGKRVPATHLHTFEANWIEGEQRMKKGKLPCAEPISQPLQTFDELRSFVGSYFRINNISVVPTPNWVYDLFRS
ncbi:hypothetical protein [Bosea sp. (in: a-proteobacteria)]|uniref:hypothetical protein n=1 Tax=Bosea sp. (in: a-proteobacteria) TaxID=1871050 RepID=UPI0027331224|nr:hypothetical protein [Bosea sp. (in: a-proteobacteria)]MDP3410928.1 hypothetical protein [Bosea sp. (in: a-proteobacteria)]